VVETLLLTWEENRFTL